MNDQGMDAISDVLIAAPLACFTCGTRIPGGKMLRYLFNVYTTKANPGDVLTDLSFVRPCCRRTVMTVPISEQAIQALQDLSPDEPGYKALVSTLFAREPAAPAPAPAPAPETSEGRRVASRGRKAEAVAPTPSASATFALPTQYPYNVYVTPKKGTSELVKGFRIYGPEDLQKVREYEIERDLKTAPRPAVLYKEYRNPTETQLAADEATAVEISRLTRTAKDLQTYGKKVKANPERYEQLHQQYEEVKTALTGARRRYGTPAPAPPAPGTPFEEESV